MLSGEAAAGFFSSIKDGRPGIGGAFGTVGMAFNLTTGASSIFGQVGGVMGIGSEVSAGVSVFSGTLEDVTAGGLEATGSYKRMFGTLGIPQRGNPGLGDALFGFAIGKGKFFGFKAGIRGGSIAAHGNPNTGRCTSAAVGLAPIC